MSTWRKTGACAGFGHRKQRRKNVFFWIARFLKNTQHNTKWAVKVFEEWQSSRRDKAPRKLASSLTALDLTNISRFDYSTKALFIWSRVPETTLPLETTLRSVYMELRVVTAAPSGTLVSLETTRQVTYWTKWRTPDTT